MRKGLALQFKERFLLNYKLYRKAAKDNLLEVGQVFISGTQELSPPFYIINFPTKTHWKEQSKLAYIRNGLDDLVRVIKRAEIKSNWNRAIFCPFHCSISNHFSYGKG